MNLQNLNFGELMRDVYNLVVSYDGYQVSLRLLETIADDLYEHMSQIAHENGLDVHTKKLSVEHIADLLDQLVEVEVISYVSNNDGFYIKVNQELAVQIADMWEALINGFGSQNDVESDEPSNDSDVNWDVEVDWKSAQETGTPDSGAEYPASGIVYMEILHGGEVLDTLKFYGLQSAKDFATLNLSAPYYTNLYRMETSIVETRKDII